MTVSVGIFHNGGSDLPAITTPEGVVVNKGTLDEVAASYQRVQVGQIRQGVLADRLGFDSWWMTEHHFQPEGAEYSPNPLQTETAIAALTTRLRLGQAANIIVWHHPIRLAEQIAMLDVISGGRVEAGMGRGYQPRENEVLGRPYGSTVQDQERNRASFEEAYQLILKAWTEPSFTHRGENFSIPPSYTKWNHKQTIAYFNQQGMGRTLDEAMKMGKNDPAIGGSPVMATTTVLKELQVYPRPVQKPHPQVWMPLTSERSIRWASANGVNGIFNVEPNSRLKQNIEVYYDEAEKKGWPDRLGRGPFKWGWDSQKRRGIICGRMIHIYDRSRDEKAERERIGRAMELQWDYYGPFGFTAVISEAGEPLYPLDLKVTADLLRERGILIDGTADYVFNKLMKMKEDVGYEDFIFNAWFEKNGFATEEIEEQMVIFAEEVMPRLQKECGGAADSPVSDVQLVPENVRRREPVA